MSDTQRAAPARPGSGSPIASPGGDGTHASASAAQDATAIWLNDTFAGTIFCRREGFDAVTANGVALGRYNSQTAAARAVLDEAQK